MGWIQKLCEAYDAGIICDQSKEMAALVPLGFVRKKVKYHVVLTLDGQFVSADELAEELQFQEIPSTPQAESRTGDKGAPFPLSEQLKYLVFEENNLQRFHQYMEQLKAWCDQPGAPDCLRAVYSYLDGHMLLADLEGQPGLKIKYYKDVKKREGTGEDTKAMVCFSVQMQDESHDDLWMRADVRESWSRYLAHKLPGNREFCYVEGKMLPVMENHPKLQGNAKLISAKDAEYPFQYRGRFTEERSAALVSIDASVRAHNALTWLISRQGMQRYGMTWVVWNTNGAAMRVPIDQKKIFLEEEEDEEIVPRRVINTLEAYARDVRSEALGRRRELDQYDPERVNCAVILGLEAATDGRMSVTYYQECPGNEYVGRLERWYQDCCWWCFNPQKKVMEITTPSAEKIAVAVMGIDAVNIAKKDKKCEKFHTKLMRTLHTQILSCISEQQQLPVNMIHDAVARVCAPLAFVSGKDRQWSRAAWTASLDTTCAMIHCFQRRKNGENAEIFGPELQTNSCDGDYLFGRLLALADRIEEKVMVRGNGCPTSAVRMMQKFVQDPFETWPKIHDKLVPVFQKSGSDIKWFQIITEEIEQAFINGDRYKRRVLSWKFLQGFSSQRQAFFQKREPTEKNKSEERSLYELPKRRSELYGCLLAIADTVEREASDGERTGKTNALKMMPMFASRPYENWERLHSKLIPYLEKLGSKSGYYQQLIGEVEMQFLQTERESTDPLDGGYLHGYYCMLQTFYQKTKFSAQTQEWEIVSDRRSALYGQMLGIADRLERRYFARNAGKEVWRASNELRFMSSFARNPASVWEVLKIKLIPYQTCAWNSTQEDTKELKHLEEELQRHGWYNNAPLGSVYLYYYYKERK